MNKTIVISLEDKPIYEFDFDFDDSFSETEIYQMAVEYIYLEKGEWN